MPPPSSGGIAVAAALGILEHFAINEHKPTDMDLNGGKPSVMGVHLISEAERLAYADRDKYVADTDFVPLPGFAADPYEDYSRPWFNTRKVLRGGSWATSTRIARPGYRNFFTPSAGTKTGIT